MLINLLSKWKPFKWFRNKKANTSLRMVYPSVSGVVVVVVVNPGIAGGGVSSLPPLSYPSFQTFSPTFPSSHFPSPCPSYLPDGCSHSYSLNESWWALYKLPHWVLVQHYYTRNELEKRLRPCTIDKKAALSLQGEQHDAAVSTILLFC